MKNYTYSIGLIIMGVNSNWAVLMVENDGFYSLPEASTESLESHDIVSDVMELSKKIGINVLQKGLAYVVEQKISDDETLITYYFLIVTNSTEAFDGYDWVLNPIGKISNIYPKKFVEEIENHIQNGGWMMGDITIIKE